jgi:hypothetical protein
MISECFPVRDYAPTNGTLPPNEPIGKPIPFLLIPNRFEVIDLHDPTPEST